MPARKRTRPTNTSDDPRDIVTGWARDVVAGKIVAGPHVRNACRRHLVDLVEGPTRGLYWDLDAALRAISFFPDVLRLNGGQFEGEKFELHPSQAFKTGSIAGWKRADGSRRFRRAYIEEAKGNGKALALDTPIATPSGWTTMGEIKTGDIVFGDDGRPCVVAKAHDVMRDRECYRVEFDDGSQIVCDAGHLWVTEQRRSTGRALGDATRGVPKEKWGQWRKGIRTTAEIAATLRYRNGNYQSANHSVALAGPLELPDSPLPIEPYTLGVWLGDGDSDCARITVGDADVELLDHLREVGTTVGPRGSGKTAAGRYRIGARSADTCYRGHDRREHTHNGHCRACERELDRAARRGEPPSTPNMISLNERLRTEGLLGNKHIPAAYFRASVAQRLALLQGLMDTDGHISPKGQCEFVVVERRLADGVRDLALGLGLKVGFSEDRATLNGRDISARYRVRFDPPEILPIFRLKRKLDRQATRHTRRRLSGDRRIVACDPVPSVPVRCITVGNESHQFLAGRQLVPTHNSPWSAGMGHYFLLADKEARAEVYAAAATKDQAFVLFRDAVAMADLSPALSKRLSKSGGNPVWNLADLASGSFFRPISSEMRKSGSGPRPSCALCDEVHEHPDGLMVEMLERGFKWRRQPLLIMTTNSGSDRNSMCWQEHQHAVRVAAGTRTPDETFTFVGEVIDDSTFAFVCALDPGDDPLKDPRCWIKANPLLGVTVKEDYLAGVVHQAQAIPGKLNGILRLHFCCWTDAETAWISRPTLEGCLADFDPAVEHSGKRVSVGADLSATQDMTALGFVVETGTVEAKQKDGTLKALPTYDAWIEAWTPEDTLAARALQDKAPYDVWVKDGFLNATPGKVVRMDFVAARIGEASTEYDLADLAYDRYAFRKNFEPELDAMGLTISLVEHPQGGKRRARPTEDEIEEAKRSGEEPPQGLWMPGSLNELETLILEGRIRFRRNPVLISAIMSAAIERDPFDNRWFSKRKATNRIDALVALAMAIGVATRKPAASAGSIYDMAEAW